MTKIIRFTIAEWKARKKSRAPQHSHHMVGKTPKIVIFPGVRVEYHDVDGSMSQPLEDGMGRKSYRLQFYPASGKSPE